MIDPEGNITSLGSENQPPVPPVQPPTPPVENESRPPVAPAQGVSVSLVRPGFTPVPRGYGLPKPPAASPAAYEQPPYEPVGDYEDDYEEEPARRSHKGVVISLIAVLAVGGAGYGAKMFMDHSSDPAFNNSLEGAISKLTGHDHPTADANGPIPTESAAPPKTTPSTPSPTNTKPTNGANKNVAPAIVPSQAACVDAIPAAVKVSQQIMLPITAESNFSSLEKVQSKYPTNWAIMSPPVLADGYTINAAALKELQNTVPALRARFASDQEGGKVARIKIMEKDSSGKLVDSIAMPGPDTISATQPDPTSLLAKITANYAAVNALGVRQIFGPVEDISTQAGQEYGRMFRSEADAAKYLPVYQSAAKAAGVLLTLKHYPNLLPYGNTDTTANVTTADYGKILSSGVLKPYESLKGTNNWAMMSNGITPGWPDKNLDNGKVDILNPAAYAALDNLTGDAPVITDAIGPNVKALNGMPVDKVAEQALKAGANVVLISNADTGKTLMQQMDAIDATVEKALADGDMSQKAFDASFLKVLGNKGLSACNVLKAYAPDTYKSLTTAKSAATATASPTGRSTPAVTSTTPAVSSTSVKTSTTLVTVKNTAVATATK